MFNFLGQLQRKSKKEAQLEMARRAAEKRKGSNAGDSIAKRLRTSHVGKGSGSQAGSPPTDLEKKVPASVVHAKPVSFALPEKLKVFGTARKKDKGKKPVEGKDPVEACRTMMTISVPTDFMSEDTIDKSEVFPTLEQFMLPAQQKRLQQADVEDLDASVVGLSFMVSLLSYDIIVRFILLFF
jgi:hypothetical protein